MSRECNLTVEPTDEGNNATRTAHVRSTTVHTILGRIKACQMAARVEATLYRETELGIMREISVVRSQVRFNVRTKNERDIENCADRRRGTIGDTYTAEQFRQIMMKVLPTWAAAAWNPRETTPSQTLWRFLLVKVLTLLSHHSLLCGASIREITLPDVFLYRLESTSSVNPDNQPVVMVIAARNSKTSKDARLQQSYAARHLEAELCAVGETSLWLHFILDQIGQFSGVDFLPPLDTTNANAGTRSISSSPKTTRSKTSSPPPATNVGLGRCGRPTRCSASGTCTPHAPEYHNMSLKETLKYEIERAAVEKIDLQEKIEMRDDTIATLTAELARLTEALRVSEARRMPSAPPSATEPAPSEGGYADSTNTGAGAKKRDEKPPKPPQTVDEARYELNVVKPWREATTVRDAWRLWNSATADDTRRLCERVAEPGFVDHLTLLKGATQGAHDMKVRRMLKAMDAVRLLRSSDGDADTEAVVAALNRIAAPGIGTFCDALTVLKPETAPTYSKEPGMGVKGLGPKVVSKLRVACAMVALNLKPRTWVADLFPDTWEEQMPKTVADLAKQTAPAQRPPTKRKKSA
ncbi:unnamed protein product [Closterium sp. Naga37s-1]|nr:unnamed protein product [Closterium sp. Naga37s-1]